MPPLQSALYDWEHPMSRNMKDLGPSGINNKYIDRDLGGVIQGNAFRIMGSMQMFDELTLGKIALPLSSPAFRINNAVIIQCNKYMGCCCRPLDLSRKEGLFGCAWIKKSQSVVGWRSMPGISTLWQVWFCLIPVKVTFEGVFNLQTQKYDWTISALALATNNKMLNTA